MITMRMEEPPVDPVVEVEIKLTLTYRASEIEALAAGFKLGRTIARDAAHVINEDESPYAAAERIGLEV